MGADYLSWSLTQYVGCRCFEFSQNIVELNNDAQIPLYKLLATLNTKMREMTLS